MPSLGRADRGPPEDPRVAFLPPLVDYSTALGQLAGGASVGSSLGMGVPGFPGLGVAMVPGERSHQSKDSLLSYQDALRQQVHSDSSSIRSDTLQRSSRPSTPCHTC